MGKKAFRDLTSFRVGGEIEYYFEAKNRNELTHVVKKAKTLALPIFIIGGGSDILVSDSRFEGVVIKYVGKNSRMSELQKSRILITADAGMEWDKLVEFAVNNGLQGIECLSGIPGMVGASPIQNIGAYGQELKDTFVKLTAYDIEKEKFVTFDNKDCLFSYRESCFKDPENWQRFIITDITLKLKKYNDPDLTLKNIRDEILRVRREKFESPNEAPNAGSFFKNPVVNLKIKNQIAKSFPDVKFYSFGNKFKIAAGWLIEKAGWKGRVLGKAAVSEKHALVLLNKTGRAKASEIFDLSEKIIKDVYEKFGIRLQREVQLINFPQKVSIVGYGIEGQDAEKYFKKKGADLTISDQKFDKNYLKDLNRFDLVVRSAGVYLYKPEFKGVNLTSPIKLFFEKCPAKIIGVTGTKGKGTTATLIYEILKKAGKDVHLAGNIGKPYLSLLPLLHNTSYIILELSSFQLIDIKSSPHIAVVLNITSDHMDWHKDQDEYVGAKKNIVRFQKASDFAVINEEYEAPKSFAKETKAKAIYFSKQKLDDKFKKDLLLRGEHNLENIAAAVAVGRVLKISDPVILKVVRSFKGLEHRLELVKTINGITFYNDSFATGPQPTIAAIKSFTEPETLILGGSDKGLSYEELGKRIEERGNIKNIILIGAIRDRIKKHLNKDLGFMIYDLGFTDMRKIVAKAFEVTPQGGVVLLSPAAASFDMFENYKDRGNQFKEVVRKLRK